MNKKDWPTLVDSHCHIDFPEFNEDLDKVLSRARDNGISKILTICTKPKNLPKVLEITNHYKNIFFAVGSHPLNKEDTDYFTRKEILEVAKHPKLVGIGETGLDYYYSSETAEKQKSHFRLHIALARECMLPLIVHSRSADDDMITILKDEYNIKPFDCVLHCFSSGVELAYTAIELGFYLSISGIAAFPKSNKLRDIFSQVPLNRLLVETDSPYLAPPPYRGKRNEPGHVVFTAKIMAEHLGLSENSFWEHTTNNFNRLFKKTEN